MWQAIADAFAAFVNLIKGMPYWVQVTFALLIMALIGWTGYHFLGPKPDDSWQNMYDGLSQTLKPTDTPVSVSESIDRLMSHARNDTQRCYTVNLFYDVGLYMTPQPEPPGNVRDFDDAAVARHLLCVAKIHRAITAAAQPAAAASLAVTVTQKGTTATSASAKTIATVETQAGNAATSQAFQASTSVGSGGWVYLGQKDVNGSGLLPDGRTIAQLTLPAAGDTVTTTTDVNLRDTPDPKIGIGRIAGVVPKGSSLRVTGHVSGIDHVVDGRKVGYYVYAPVSLTQKVQNVAAASAAPSASAQPAASPSVQPTP